MNLFHTGAYLKKNSKSNPVMNYGLATTEDKIKNIQTENFLLKQVNQIEPKLVIDRKILSENKTGRV